jgi:hypothetical protein
LAVQEKIASGYGAAVGLVDAGRWLHEMNSGFTTGREFFLEHVHLTMTGRAAVAELIVDGMAALWELAPAAMDEANAAAWWERFPDVERDLRHDVFFTGYDDDVVGDYNLIPETENVVIPANSTVMFAFFAVYGSAGVGATPQETSAFMTVLEAQFAVFNQAFTSSSILAKGIPNGANVLNWGVVAPAPSPSASPTTAPAASLAKTGAEVDWLLIGSLIAVVAGAGLFALGRGRRTV